MPNEMTFQMIFKWLLKWLSKWLQFPIFKLQDSWRLKILTNLSLFELDSKVALTHFQFVPYCSGLILVTSSFVTFWIEWNAEPARVMLGVTTMLNFFTTSNKLFWNLPQTNNKTSILGSDLSYQLFLIWLQWTCGMESVCSSSMHLFLSSSLSITLQDGSKIQNRRSRKRTMQYLM